jgi:hypothetical protein
MTQDAQVSADAPRVSISLDELSLEQLVGLSQRFAREEDRIREQRAHLRRKIEERIARGERTSIDLVKNARALALRGVDAATKALEAANATGKQLVIDEAQAALDAAVALLEKHPPEPAENMAGTAQDGAAPGASIEVKQG